MDYLHNAAQLLNYPQYLIQKFDWNPTTPNLIQWQIIELAMRQFQSPDQTQIQKIIHKWAPMQISPGNYPSKVQDQQCPTCCQHPETPLHLLQCNHSKRKPIFATMQHQLLVLSAKHQVNLHIHQLWWLGLKALIHGSPQLEKTMYPTQFHKIFSTQEKIGWKQLYYRWISTEWINDLQQHNQHQTNAIQYFSQVLTITWTGLLQLWQLQNSDNNATQSHHPWIWTQTSQESSAPDTNFPNKLRTGYLHWQGKNFSANQKLTPKNGSATAPSTFVMNWRQQKHNSLPTIMTYANS